MELKSYQKEALKAIHEYLSACTVKRPKEAFEERMKVLSIRDRDYHLPAGLEDIPYFCIRIPTGGGKTFVAACAVETVADTYLHTEHPVVLWIVPTDTIRNQTLKALQQRGHPYREALERAFPNGSVTAMEASEALFALRKPVLDSGPTIIVASRQMFTVKDPTIRKAYESNGDLQHHFTGMGVDKVDPLGLTPDGTYPYSLVNVLRMRQPIIMLDEAHMARTGLTFETLGKFKPSCIMEFTATPLDREPFSNVLHSVTAWELKEESMIKMPIILTGDLGDWRAAITAAIAKRHELEEIAKKEAQETGEYIRPILLIQAQSHFEERESLHEGYIQQWLMDHAGLSKEECPIVTGEINQVGERNLLDEGCNIRYIVTKQALREGWDCSFAYVLCSLVNIHQAKDLEQILGRVMRLPKATPKKRPELNNAYAFVTPDSNKVAAVLEQGLIKNGFEKWEAPQAVRIAGQTGLGLGAGPLFPAGDQLTYELRVPRVCVKEGDFFEPLEETHLIDTDWSMDECTVLSEQEYVVRSEGETLAVDVSEEGRLQIRRVAKMQSQQSAFDDIGSRDEAWLINLLDTKIKHGLIPQDEFRKYLMRVLADLKGRVSLQVILRDPFHLLDCLQHKVDSFLVSVKTKALLSLFDETGEVPLKTVLGNPFEFTPELLLGDKEYQGKYTFQHYAFPSHVGDMNDEEAACAFHIDGLWPEVVTWVRNPSRRGYSLRTSTDLHYPDFMCLLKGDRWLAVEYKSEHDWTNEDSGQKRLAGAVWEKGSGGKHLYVMPKGMSNHFHEIDEKIHGGLTRIGEGGQVEISS
jgi:superfamily II DNA or RNA helicase